MFGLLVDWLLGCLGFLVDGYFVCLVALVGWKFGWGKFDEKKSVEISALSISL